MRVPDLSLYLVTDQRIPWSDCLKSIRLAVQGGVSLVQLREKERPVKEIRQRAFDLIEMLKPRNIPLIVNDHVEIALEVEAHGVHLGRRDCRVKEARRLLGPDKIIGLSIGSLVELEDSDLDDCNYVSASAVFPTRTKLDLGSPLGLDNLRTMRGACRLPLCAIGGIHVGNAKFLGAVGVDGISVVSSIFGSSDPRVSARRLRQQFEAGRRVWIENA